MVAATAVGAASDIGEIYDLLAGEDSGGTVTGYSLDLPAGDFGELTDPDLPGSQPKTAFGNFLIMGVQFIKGNDTLVIVFEGHVGQASFRGVDVRPAVGGVFFTADATFFIQSSLPDRTQWGWADVGELRDGLEYEVTIVG